jgi:hypothetical protein
MSHFVLKGKTSKSGKTLLSNFDKKKVFKLFYLV